MEDKSEHSQKCGTDAPSRHDTSPRRTDRRRSHQRSAAGGRHLVAAGCVSQLSFIAAHSGRVCARRAGQPSIEIPEGIFVRLVSTVLVNTSVSPPKLNRLAAVMTGRKGRRPDGRGDVATSRSLQCLGWAGKGPLVANRNRLITIRRF